MIVAALLVAGCVAPVVREKGMGPSLATAAALEAALEPRRRAIVIGIDDYRSPAFPDLKHAVDDAEALADVLRADRGGAFDEVVALTTPEATTRESIVRALQEARSELRREDELVVYFSGHGTRVRAADRYVRYLLASDSQPSDLDGTAVDLVAVQAFFATLAPARKALVVDACFHGEGKSVVRPDPFDGAPILDDALVPRATTMGPAEAHLFATSPGRPSLESDALGHGVYTNFLLEALTWGLDDADRDEDGVVTVWEAHDHARGRTIAYTNGAQVPEAAFRVVGEADLVLAGDPAARARTTALLYLYASAEPKWEGVDVLIDGRARGALPGTVSVHGGRHRVTLTKDGADLLDGYVTLRAGQSYRVDDLVRIAAGPQGALTTRPVAVLSPPLRASVGPGVTGAELEGAWRRDEGPARGLTSALRIGGGGAPTRFVDDLPTSAGRAVGWAGAGLAYQWDLRRVRLRGGWGATGVLIPPSWLGERPAGPIDPSEVPSEAGWVFFATGPELSVGAVVSEAWAITLTTRPHAALLDPDGDARAGLVPWWTTGLGVELSW